MRINELTNEEIQEYIKDYKLIIDARPTDAFVNGYLKGAINIILNEHFDARANYFSELHNEVLIIAQEDHLNDLKELVGDNLKKKVIGVLTQNFETWQKNNLPLDMIINVDSYELKLDIQHDDKAIVLDVRTDIQYNDEHVVGAVNMQMNDFRDPAKIGLLDENSNLYLHCNGGTRSVLLTSVLKRNGFHNVRNIEGGFKAVLADGNIPLTSNNKKSQN